MLSRKYIFDEATGLFKKSVISLRDFLKLAVKYLAAASVLAMLWYLLFALLMSTDVEKKLKEENRIYEEQYSGMKQDMNLLTAVVKGLGYRDQAIYRNIFESEIPESSDFDTVISDDDEVSHDVLSYTTSALAKAEAGASAVDENFRKIFALLQADGAAIPPLRAPVDDFSPIRVGASVGSKMSPFLKMEITHEGMDIIAASGTPVKAAADGVVLSVSRSSKGHGNVVAIRHDGGYVTRYGNLGTVGVQAGQEVKAGRRIGTVGLSGLSYAPHIHYEVIRDSQVCDPSNYMFASVTPDGYADMLLISSSTTQSLD